MKVESLAIADVKLIMPSRFHDPRGTLAVTWNHHSFAEAGVHGTFIQDNHSVSRAAGVLRGMHCQIGRNAQGKLVRVIKGAIFDVAVDVRQGSPTFGKYVSAILSAENWTQLWVPVGFLHGYCTLVEESEVIFKVTGEYDKEAERGVRWDDPDIGVAWPVSVGNVVLLDKDKVLPRLSDCPAWFRV
jgi:dTDP-4-dehydrorhamnose 3,5-epimerase